MLNKWEGLHPAITTRRYIMKRGKKYQEAAIESFRLADWVFENIPVKDIPAEYGIKMNTVYEMLSNLGIEVEG